MNREMIRRLMEARKYQRKALKALFPENMQGHLTVIETEFGAMIKEGLLEVLQSDFMKDEETKEEEKSTESSTARKVDIA